MANSKGGIQGLSIGRSDTYRIDPRLLHVKEGWNCRIKNFDPNDAEDLALAKSIAEVGQKEPTTVCYEDGKACITNGHRRYFAAMYAIEHLGAEIKSVPVQTEERYSSEADRVFSQIVRNDGKPLAPMEKARVYKRLIDLGWKESDIADRSGVTRQWVVDLLNLQAAPEPVTKLVNDGSVSATLAVNTLKQSGGDGKKAAADLGKAVETAKAEGKTRATAKHMEGSEKKPNLKAQLKLLFGEAEIRPAKDDSGRHVIVLTPQAYDRMRELLGI